MTASLMGPAVLMSIKPSYAEAIFSGTKRVEFRKKIVLHLFDEDLINDPVAVFLYVTAPVKHIVGVCNLNPIVCDYADRLFLKYGNIGEISESELVKYAGDKQVWACEINDAEAFAQICDPYSVFEGFVPPQNMRYCTEGEKQKLIRYCPNYDADMEAQP